MLNKKVAFIGAGNMAEAFCRGMQEANLVKPKNILLCDIRPISQIAWARILKKGFVYTAIAAKAVEWADVVILAVKPKDLDAVLREINNGVAKRRLEKKLFISIAAGKKLQRLEGLLGSGVPVIRVMPNTPCLVGMGASAYSLGRRANRLHARIVEDILGATGKTIRFNESLMDAVTAVSGSGPAYVFLFMEALEAAGVKAGLPSDASHILAAQTIRGAAEMVQKSGDSPSLLRKKVTSPGGTTEKAIQVLENGGLRGLMEKAVLAARDRSREMGKGS